MGIPVRLSFVCSTLFPGIFGNKQVVVDIPVINLLPGCKVILYHLQNDFAILIASDGFLPSLLGVECDRRIATRIGGSGNFIAYVVPGRDKKWRFSSLVLVLEISMGICSGWI